MKRDSTFEITNAALLYGPPGTGKTNFALALANLTKDTTFIKVTNAQLKGEYHGQSEKNIFGVFEMAKALEPAILFFDEAEQILGNRERQQGSEHGKDMTAQFLALMQASSPGIFIIAATNYPKDIDSAIRRRFQKKFMVDMPTAGERSLMLKYHLKNLFSLISDDEFRQVGHAMESFTPSDVQTLARIVGEHALMELDDATHFKPCFYRLGQWVPADPLDSEAVPVKPTETDDPKYSANPIFYRDLRQIMKFYEPDGKQISEEHLTELRSFQQKKF